LILAACHPYCFDLAQAISQSKAFKFIPNAKSVFFCYITVLLLAMSMVRPHMLLHVLPSQQL
jgi:hypothetical protein